MNYDSFIPAIADTGGWLGLAGLRLSLYNRCQAFLARCTSMIN